jgi:hypothetical protein
MLTMFTRPDKLLPLLLCLIAASACDPGAAEAPAPVASAEAAITPGVCIPPTFKAHFEELDGTPIFAQPPATLVLFTYVNPVAPGDPERITLFGVDAYADQVAFEIEMPIAVYPAFLGSKHGPPVLVGPNQLAFQPFHGIDHIIDLDVISPGGPKPKPGGDPPPPPPPAPERPSYSYLVAISHALVEAHDGLDPANYACASGDDGK